MTPEGKVKHAVKKVLEAAGAYFHMPVQNGMGKPSLDFVGCFNGLFYAIETKAGKGQLTLRQEATIREMQAAGAAVLVIRGAGEEDLMPLKVWLGLNEPTTPVPAPIPKTQPMSELFAEEESKRMKSMQHGLFDDLGPDSYF